MFRRSLGADQGLAFSPGPPQLAAIWMKKHAVSARYDLYSQRQGGFSFGGFGAQSEKMIVSEAPVDWVIEVNAGTAREWGIDPATVAKPETQNGGFWR